MNSSNAMRVQGAGPTEGDGYPIDARLIQAGPGGNPVTAFQGTIPWIISGSVTAFQGTIPWIITGDVNAFQPWLPNVFVTVQTQAGGNTALWTPAAGKKFRLARYMVTVDGNVIGGPGTLNISLFDGAAGGLGQVHNSFIPAVSINASGALYTSPWVDLGQGVLSAAANNVLNVNLSVPIAGGFVRVIACGREE